MTTPRQQSRNEISGFSMAHRGEYMGRNCLCGSISRAIINDCRVKKRWLQKKNRKERRIFSEIIVLVPRGFAILFFPADFSATHRRRVLFEFNHDQSPGAREFRFRARKLQPFISRYASPLINENVEKIRANNGREMRGASVLFYRQQRIHVNMYVCTLRAPATNIGWTPNI